jgi:hypothetical protein
MFHKKLKCNVLFKLFLWELNFNNVSFNFSRSPVFGSIVENILENSLSNILIEAFNDEFSLTNRPRLIALPPKTQVNNSSSINLQSQRLISSKERNEIQVPTENKTITTPSLTVRSANTVSDTKKN